jgi:uncharacterized protein with HEPN domain
MSRDDEYALDVLNAARTALSFVGDMTNEAFLGDVKTQSAVLFQLTVLGEAARRVSEVYRAQHPVVPWAQMAATRNRIVHEYDEIDLDIVWEVVSRELPELVAQLQVFVQDHP